MGRGGPGDGAAVNVAAFLTRGLAWGLAGLTLLQTADLSGGGLLLLAICWLAGLAGVGAITASGNLQNNYRWLSAWGFMVVLFLLMSIAGRQ